MTIFTIFGHTGFIGSHLKKKLKKHKLILPKRGQIQINKFLGNIIYCIGSDDWMKDYYNSYKANIGFVPEIIHKNRFNSFTFLSTTRIYKKSKSTYENTLIRVNPNDRDDFYNLKKICAESLLLSQNKKINIIRLSNVYGENFGSPLVLPKFINDAINKKKIFLTINKNSSKDFLNIQDAIEMIYQISKKNKGGVYNVASGKMYKLITIAKELKKITGCKIILKNQNILVKEPKININKIKKDFKFRAKSDLLSDLDILVKKFQDYNGNKL